MAEGKRVVNGEGEGFVMMRFPGIVLASYVEHLQPLSFARQIAILSPGWLLLQ